GADLPHYLCGPENLRLDELTARPPDTPKVENFFNRLDAPVMNPLQRPRLADDAASAVEQAEARVLQEDFPHAKKRAGHIVIVGVHVGADVAGGMGKPLVQRVALTPVFLRNDEVDPAIIARENFRGAVRAP